MTDEIVLAAFTRAGAEVLHMAASVGLKTDEHGVDLDAGEEANQALRKALDSEPEAEVAVVRSGISALETIASHDPDLVCYDDDGPGIVSREEHADLLRLLQLLRDGSADVDPPPRDDIDAPSRPAEASAVFAGVRATVRIDPDPDPDFADTHLRVTLTCDPPPRGYDREVWSGPILLPKGGNA